MKPVTLNLIGLGFGVFALLAALIGSVIGTSTTWTPIISVVASLAIALNIFGLQRNLESREGQ